MKLRDVTEADLPILFEHQREPAANEMAAFPPRQREPFMEHWRTRVLAVPGNRALTIEVDGAVAGNIGSWEQDGKRFVGYWIGSAHWGRGVATAALREFVAQHDTARPLHAFVAVANVGSVRVLEKCGFARVAEPATDPHGVVEILLRLD